MLNAELTGGVNHDKSKKTRFLTQVSIRGSSSCPVCVALIRRSRSNREEIKEDILILGPINPVKFVSQALVRS